MSVGDELFCLSRPRLAREIGRGGGVGGGASSCVGGGTSSCVGGGTSLCVGGGVCDVGGGTLCGGERWCWRRSM